MPRVRSGPFTMIALVIIGWAMLRSLWVATHWLAMAPLPHDPPKPATYAAQAMPPVPIGAAQPSAPREQAGSVMMARAARTAVAAVTVGATPAMPTPVISSGGFGALQRALLRSGPAGFSRRFAIADAPSAFQSPLANIAAHTQPTRQRWTLSAWAFYRPHARVQQGSGLYGGSQAGVRAAYALADGWQVYGRLSATPVTRDSAEGAVGLALRPVAHVPLTLAIERRARIAGDGDSAFAAYVSGGVSHLAAPAQFRIDAYGAAGLVGASRRDGFAEGAATARRQVARLARAQLSAGAGVWGGTQTGTSRLDIGPSVALRWDGAPLNLSFDWRQRMAGNAAPRSGPAITLSADF